MDSTALRQAISEAAHWYAQLNESSVSDEQKRQWQQWLQASEYHQMAWQQMEAIHLQCQAVPSSMASPALEQSHLSRRRMMQALLSLAALAPTTWLGYRYASNPATRASLITGVGEISREILPDGSHLVLNTDSAADIGFTDQQRAIYLHQGELQITTSHAQHSHSAPRESLTDSYSARILKSGADASPSNTETQQPPLIVYTPHGSVQALGTQFQVRLFDSHTQVSVSQHKVRITPGLGPSYLLSADQVSEFSLHTSARTSVATPSDHQLNSWTSGSLVVVNMPLGQLIEALSRYRHGVLSCAPEIADLKVSGAYPLRDTNRSLDVLAHSFPVQIHRYTDYWVRITPVS